MKFVGDALGRFLSQGAHFHGACEPTPPDRLKAALRPGDVLLVEGISRIGVAIKYLTQSTWSHAALFVGSHGDGLLRAPDHCFVEADLVAGVRSVGIDEFSKLHTRVCRPIGLRDEDLRRVTKFAIDRIGQQYDLRNVVDLARYLIPTPPVPSRFRRRMIALGSGDPTRAICSTLIAQAFESIGYPILPIVEHRPARRDDCPECVEEVLHIRHHSLYTPRDFDVSPYFQILKPSIDATFDYRSLVWSDAEQTATSG